MSDIWAIGISMLELLFEDSNFVDGCEQAIMWKLEHWNSEFFIHFFENINGWNNAPDNSLLGLIKMLLRVDCAQRLSAADALNHPLLSDSNNQITENELKRLMSELIKLRANPPKPPEISSGSSADETLFASGLHYADANYQGLSAELYAQDEHNYLMPSSGETSPRSPAAEKYCDPNLDPAQNSDNNNNTDQDSSGKSMKY